MPVFQSLLEDKSPVLIISTDECWWPIHIDEYHPPKSSNTSALVAPVFNNSQSFYVNTTLTPIAIV
jgi:hypothetical protein